MTATLVRTRDQAPLWTATFDSEPTGVLDLQRELADAIAQQVRRRLEPSRLAALGCRQTRNVEAFYSYLRGRHCWHLLTPATTRRRSSTSARNAERRRLRARLSGIADAYTGMPMTGATRHRAWCRGMPPRPRSTPFAAQPDLAEVQASIGFRKFRLDWDWLGPEVAFRRAIGFIRATAFSFAMIGHLHSHRGEVRESLTAMRRSRGSSRCCR